MGLVSPTQSPRGPWPQLGKPGPDRLIHWTEICKNFSGRDPRAAAQCQSSSAEPQKDCIISAAILRNYQGQLTVYIYLLL